MTALYSYALYSYAVGIFFAGCLALSGIVIGASLAEAWAWMRGRL